MRRSFYRLASTGAAWIDESMKNETSRKLQMQPEPVVQPMKNAMPFAEDVHEVVPDELSVPKKAVKKKRKHLRIPMIKPVDENKLLLPREDILAQEAAIIRKTYEGVDVRSPATLPTNHQIPGTIPKGNISWRDKVLAVSDFISGHLAHHVMMEEWAVLFDLENLDIEIRYFLWIIHLQLISRRSLTIPVEKWARRREVLQEIQISMKSSWEESCTQVLGRAPLERHKAYLMDMYYVVAMNFEEALSGTALNAKLSNSKEIVPSTTDSDSLENGSDMALFSFFHRFIPYVRPEDLPVYSLYRLVHYVRFHMALLDRLSDEDILKGNFNFINPMSNSICESYEDVPLS